MNMEAKLSHLNRNGPFLRLKRDIAYGSLKDIKYAVKHGYIDFRNDVYTNLACGFKRLDILKYLIRIGCKVNVFECIKSMTVRDLDIFDPSEYRFVASRDSLYTMLHYFLPKFCTVGKTFSVRTLLLHGLHDMYTGSILSGEYNTISLLVKYFGTKNFSVYTHANARMILFLLRKKFPVYIRDYKYILELFAADGRITTAFLKHIIVYQKGLIYGDVAPQTNINAHDKSMYDDSFLNIYEIPGQVLSNAQRNLIRASRNGGVSYMRRQAANTIQKAYKKHYAKRLAAAKIIKLAAIHFVRSPVTRRAYFHGRTVTIHPKKTVQKFVRSRSTSNYASSSRPVSPRSYPIHINTQERIPKPRINTSFLKEFATINKLYRT